MICSQVMNKIRLKDKLGAESGAWASNVSWVIAGKCISMGFFQAFDILIARVLEVKGYSEWAYFFSVLSILYYFGWLGVNASSRVIVSKPTDRGTRNEYLYSAVITRIMVSVFVCIILFSISEKLTRALNPDNKYPHMAILMKVGVGIIFFNSFVEFYKDIFQGMQRYKYIFRISVFEYGGYFLFSAVLLFVNKEVYAVAWAYCAAGIITVIMATRLLIAEFKDGWSGILNRTVIVNHVVEILRYAMPMILLSVGSVVLMEMDVFMLGYMSNAHEIAIYNVAKQLCHKATHLNYSLAMGTVVSVSIITRDNYKQRRASFQKIRRMNYALILAVAIILVIIGHWFVPLFYGREFEEAGKIMYILTIYYAIYGVSMLNGFFLDYQKKAGSRSVWYLAAAAANFVLNYLLIPKFGSAGAAIATVVSQIPYAVYVFFAANNVFISIEKLVQNNNQTL